MSPEITETLWVGLGGGLGGVARYSIGIAIACLAGSKFLWGTLIVNILGSFLLAYLGIPLLADGSLQTGHDLRFLVAIGVYGGFTTFSCFSLETVDLLRSGEIFRAMLYVVGSVGLCLAAAGLGIYSSHP
jgi:CrcB protein